MMLILSAILICSYLYPVCLVSQVLKDTDFKQHLSVVALCLNRTPIEKAWIHEILFHQVVIVMVKDENRCTIKHTMSIKVSFMHHITWTRVKLPVVFEELDMVYILRVARLCYAGYLTGSPKRNFEHEILKSVLNGLDVGDINHSSEFYSNSRHLFLSKLLKGLRASLALL